MTANAECGKDACECGPLALAVEYPTDFNNMPPGLSGYWWETDNMVCVPLVIASQKGAFSAFLRSIEAKGKTVFFPTIISAKLNAILRARGYVDAFVLDDKVGLIDGLARLQGGKP